MASPVEPSEHLVGDPPAAASPQAQVDRRELALIAVERTRMPMVVTDPRQQDNPIVLANQAFLDLTGYSAEEVVGRNCRFLQGPETDGAAVAMARTAIAEEREATIALLNYRKDGTSFWNELHISPIHDDEGRLVYFFASQKDVTQRLVAQQFEAAERRLLREVDHRAKNVLALVQGIVRLSRADDAEAYAQAVQGRVDALARAHAHLAEQRWRGVPLDRLIWGEVEPFGTQRVTIGGPPIEIPATQVQPLALLFHELLTNAASHGALSTREGRVEVVWGALDDAEGVSIRWHEAGGPPPPAHREPGFGFRIMDALVRRQLGGRMVSDWRPEGFASELVVYTQPARQS